jgi:hypothetical protein
MKAARGIQNPEQVPTLSSQGIDKNLPNRRVRLAQLVASRELQRRDHPRCAPASDRGWLRAALFVCADALEIIS